MVGKLAVREEPLEAARERASQKREGEEGEEKGSQQRGGGSMDGWIMLPFCKAPKRHKILHRCR